MELIRLENISKTYHNSNTPALKDVNLTISGGDYISVEGVSGSGKSTLLSVMAGLCIPTTGRVFYEGKDVYAFSDSEMSKWRGKSMGYLFQNVQLAKALTVRENLSFARRYGNDKKADIDELLEVLGLKDVSDHLPGQLSGGQKRRAMIASVLSRKPRIILADEPTNDLDHEWAARLIDYLQAKITDDTALVLVTHDTRWAKDAQIHYRIEDGTIVPM